MEKIYTKDGYTYKGADGLDKFVPKSVVQKAIVDQTKLATNINTNLNNLNVDLEAINNS